MPLRILLAALVALACSTSQAGATGPQYGPMSGGGASITANACDPGDYAVGIAVDGTLTCEPVTATYDVRQYGALCNDSADDTAEIQAAIDAAEATGQGGVVELPVGICRVTGLNMNEPGIILRGQGASTSNNGTVLSCDITTGTCVTLDTSCTYCGVEKMQLNGRGASTTLLLIDGTNASNDFARDLITTNYCTAVKNVLRNDRIDLFGPVAGASCRGISIVDDAAYLNRVTGNWANDIEGMVVIEQTGTNIVDTVVISDTEIAQSGGAGAGLKIIGASTTNPPRWVEVVNSLFEAKTTGATTGDYPLYIDNVKEFKCTNCYFHGGYRAAVIDGGPGPIRFVNSEVGDSRREAFYHNADVPTELIGTTVSDGSQETTNTYSGVYLTANSRQFTMIGGRASDDLFFTGSGQKYGIEVISGADEYRFDNVGCEGNDTACASGLTPATNQAAFTDAVAFADSDWSNSIVVQAPGTVAANYVLKLPTTDGNANELLLTDGSGATSWTAITDALVPNTITLDNITQITNRAHSSLSGLTSGDDHTQYALLAGRSGGQTLSGSQTTAQDLTLRPNSADTTTGELNFDAPRIDLYPSFPASTSSTTPWYLLDFDNTTSLTAAGGGQSLTGMSFRPSLTVASSAATIIRGDSFEPTIDLTDTNNPLSVYQVNGSVCAPTFTSSTASGTLYQDCFIDLTTVNYSGASDVSSTRNPYNPYSFVSQMRFRTSGAGDLAIPQTSGMHTRLLVGTNNNSSTLTFDKYSAVSARQPECDYNGSASGLCRGPGTTGTTVITSWAGLDTDWSVTFPSPGLSIGTAYGIRLIDFDDATTNYTLWSDSDASMYHGGKVDIGDAVADVSSGTTNIIDVTPTIDVSGGSLNSYAFLPTTTLSGVATGFAGISVAPTLSHNVTLGTLYALAMGGTVTSTNASSSLAAFILNQSTTYTTTTANAEPVLNSIALNNGPVVEYAASSGTGTPNSVITAKHNPTIRSKVSGGAMTLTSDTGFEASGTISAATGSTTTITTRRGFLVNDITKSASGGTETVTTNIGVDIAALSNGATNIGIRNADATVYTPGSAQTLNAVGSSITPSATYIQVTASGATGTLTSNPQIADGVDGQIIYIVYTNGATGSFTFADGNGLKLAGTMLMDQDNSITLMYSSAIGDWIELARSLN